VEKKDLGGGAFHFLMESQHSFNEMTSAGLKLVQYVGENDAK